jgi:hypothetical protein
MLALPSVSTAPIRLDNSQFSDKIVDGSNDALRITSLAAWLGRFIA